MNTLLIALLFTALIGSAQAQFFTDDFSGGSLDSANWTTIIPQGGASVIQSGGKVTTTARGILATVNGFSSPYSISGTFTMLSDTEHLNIALRTDLSSTGLSSSFERAGLLVSFSNNGDQVSIQRFVSSSDNSILAQTSLSLLSNQPYSFSILDTGTSISLTVDSVNLLTANTTFSTGSKVAFYSRESASSNIDSLTISSAIPEPDTWGLMAGGVALGFFALKGGRRK